MATARFLLPSRLVQIQGDALGLVVREFNRDGRADAIVTSGAISTNQALVLFGTSM